MNERSTPDCLRVELVFSLVLWFRVLEFNDEGFILFLKRVMWYVLVRNIYFSFYSSVGLVEC